MRFDLDALPQIGHQPTSDGTPLMLSLAAIDEDPRQPRTEFDPERLQELAASITQRGVLQAISVRRHPEQPERWILNFGARRLRASKLAGLTQIPAYVNETASSYDQMIENEHREGLKPLELALFVQSRIARGESPAEIARGLSKTPAYVSYAMAMIGAPDWLMDVYRQGKCRGLTELYQLRRLHERAPQRVQAWIDEQTSISRSDVQRLKRELESEAEASDLIEPSKSKAMDMMPAPAALNSTAGPPTDKVAVPMATDMDSSTSKTATQRHQEPAARSSETHPSKRCLVGELSGQIVEIVLDIVPRQPGHVFVRVPELPETTEVRARDLVLVGFRSAAGT
jgi:ParB family transcriptional regulator, chromosome partitioning protein